MRVTKNNTYLRRHGSGYAVHIEMPDKSRNFLHCESMPLEKAIELRDNIIDQEIVAEIIKIRKHPKYPKYYRIVIPAETARIKTIFHSRALNLNDVIAERTLLVTEE